jgi:monothiol glutaredoxin
MKTKLEMEKVHSEAIKEVEAFHPWIVEEVKALVQQHDVVVVGMAMNPVVKSALKKLQAHSITHHYVEYGSYFSKWKPRLALKMWAGWPTFPMIFHKGVLVGGASNLEKYIQNGHLKPKS